MVPDRLERLWPRVMHLGTSWKCSHSCPGSGLPQALPWETWTYVSWRVPLGEGCCHDMSQTQVCRVNWSNHAPTLHLAACWQWLTRDSWTPTPVQGCTSEVQLVEPQRSWLAYWTYLSQQQKQEAVWITGLYPALDCVPCVCCSISWHRGTWLVPNLQLVFCLWPSGILSWPDFGFQLVVLMSSFSSASDLLVSWPRWPLTPVLWLALATRSGCRQPEHDSALLHTIIIFSDIDQREISVSHINCHTVPSQAIIG